MPQIAVTHATGVPVSLFDPELRANAYLPRVVAYYYKHWDGYQMAFHSHVAVEIMYVISGKCTVFTDTDALRLTKGDAILLDSGVPHRLWMETDASCRMLNAEFIFEPRKGAFPSLAETAAEEPALGRLLAEARPHLVVRDVMDVYQTLKSLVMEMDERQGEPAWMVRLLMNELLVRLARLAGESEPDEKPYDAYIRKTVRFLRQNYDRDIQVKDAAAEVNLHPGYLQRIFKERMGCTLMAYLTDLRIEKAKMLLFRTDLPVIDIPDYIGINSREYFSALFKKHVGLSPAEYRRTRETFVH